MFTAHQLQVRIVINEKVGCGPILLVAGHIHTEVHAHLGFKTLGKFQTNTPCLKIRHLHKSRDPDILDQLCPFCPGHADLGHSNHPVGRDQESPVIVFFLCFCLSHFIFVTPGMLSWIIQSSGVSSILQFTEYNHPMS